MPWNGSGTFNRVHDFTDDAAADIQAQADRFDAEFDGIVTGLENCQTLDGQTTPTAIIPMGGFKHAGVAAATSADQYLRYDQVASFSATTSAETAAGVTPIDTRYPPGNVLRYGADLTGVADSQSAFQDAIDSSDRVYVPEGDYILNDYVTLRTDTNIVGDGIGATKITKNADTTGSFGLFYANSGASGTFVSNIQLRNFEMDGLVGSKSFSEFQHLVSLNGVADVIIENVKFTGPQGDAIYLGSQGGERHNHNVIIKNNIFDGVNNDNRNAVSIIDGDGVIIANNHFHDFTKSTMPGAIDVEPNANAYHVVSNIEITSNTFENITGSAGVVNFVLTAATFTNQPESFIVSNNIFDVTVTAIVFDSDANYARPIGMVFNNNSTTTPERSQTLPTSRGAWRALFIPTTTSM
jgi:hypothetical protein